ncbi:hypothetical protein LINPERHAP1_LOCUS30978, partial [Linum perenne]
SSFIPIIHLIINPSSVEFITVLAGKSFLTRYSCCHSGGDVVEMQTYDRIR